MPLTNEEIQTLTEGQDAIKALYISAQQMHGVFLLVQGAIDVNPAIIDYPTLKQEFQAQYIAARQMLNSDWAAWEAADQAILQL